MENAYPAIPVVQGRKVAKAFVKYDHYLLDSSREIFKDDSKPLREYLKIKAMVATTPCNSAREGRLLLPGEPFTYQARVSTEYGKKYSRSMLKALWKNDQNGECFSDFDASNMFASESGRAMFHGVTRMNRTPAQAKRNYESARVILSDIYSQGGAIPKDIHHLLGLIENYPSKAGLFHIHASLVSLSKRQPSFFKMYEQLKYKITDDFTRGEILLGLPYSEDWKVRIGGNRLLKRIHDFKPEIYQVADSPQQQTPLTFDEKLAHGKKRKRAETSKMAKYLRHRTAHRMDDVEKEVGGYRAEDSELVALVRLPLAHPSLQEGLYDAGQLQHLHFDELF